MTQDIGVVQNIEGTFFAKLSNGDIVQLESGDIITEGMIIFGDKESTQASRLEVVMNGDAENIVLNAYDEQLFDSSLVNGSSDVEEGVYADNVDAIDSDIEMDTENEDENFDEETEAGDDKIKDSDGEAQFAARDGNLVDVNSGLRKAIFPSGMAYELEDQFYSEDEDGLNPITNPDEPTIPDRPDPILPPTPPPVIPPVIPPEPEPSIPIVPTIAINDVSMYEENGFMIFTVTSSAPIGSDVTFSYKTVDGSAKDGIDYSALTGTGTIKAGDDSTTIKVPIIDDFYAEDDEQFSIVLSDISLNATIDDGTGIGTILDNGIPDGTPPNEPDNPNSPDTPNTFDSEDTVFVKLTTDASVNEGDDLVHGIKLVDANGADVLLLDGQSITVTLTYTPDAIDGADATTDYTAQTTVTITGSVAGNGSSIITNPTLDDIFTENIEGYTLSVNNITDNANSFENILDEGSTVIGTITDDGTIVNTRETTKIVLIALDENGDAILAPNGDYTFANDVNEDSAASYKALAFSSTETSFNLSTQLSSQLGSVVVSSVDTASATSGVDYTQQTQTIALDAPFSIDTLDDFISDNGETYNVVIDSYVEPTTGLKYENVTVDGAVTTTILDNSKNTPDTPYDEGTPGNPPVETDLDTITIRLFAIDPADGTTRVPANEVAEGSAAEYIAVAFDKDGNEVLTNETVEVTFGKAGDTATAGDATTGDYTATTQTVTLGTKFSTGTTDDYISDNGETFKIQITDETLSNAEDYETVVIDTTSVETTILDNSKNTPDTPYDEGTPGNPPVETDLDTITIRLFAIDPADGTTRVPANEVAEGSAAEYIAVAFDKDGNEVLTNETVEVTFGKAGDTATAGDATTGDYTATTQTVTLGTKFSTGTTDDYISDNGETFKIQITDETLSNAEDYETVVIDTTSVETTILDNSKNTPDTPYDEDTPGNPPVETDLDTITIRLFAIDPADGTTRVPANEVAEGSAAEYIAVAFDKDGNEVLTNETVEVTFGKAGDTATAGDATTGDYTATTQTVTLGTKFSTGTTDDYISDNGETFKIQITDETLSNAEDYETVVIDTTSVETTILDNSKNTPDTPYDEDTPGNPPVETDLDTITIRLFAISEIDGSRVPANEVAEGSAAEYIAVAFDKDGNEVLTNETVEVTFGKAGDTATAGDATTGDYTATTQTVTLGTKFSTGTTDDYISDNGETFKIQITDETLSNAEDYETVVIDTTSVETTILDNSKNTPDTPYDEDTPGNPPVETDLDTITIRLFAISEIDGSRVPANEVAEGSAAEYIAVAFDKDGNEVLTNETVEVTFGKAGDTATAGDTTTGDYTATTQTVTLGTKFSTGTTDDYISDNGETFKIQITDETLSNAEDYETVVIDTTSVETTILDDTGTPNDLPDGPEPDHEAVIIKLVACDANGNPIFELDGKTYTYVNDAQEGSVAQYMAVAFAPGETVFTTDTDITPDGTVDVTFVNGSATGAATQGTTLDGSKDFDNDGQTVTVGDAFSTDIFDDYLKEGEHDYTVNITAGSYTPPTPTTGWENVTESGSVVTTISDDEAGGGGTPPGDEFPNEPIDTVYVRIDNNVSTTEGGTLTHKLTLVDKNDNEVTIPAGKTVTVDMVYTSSNGVLDGDFTTIVKQVVITGGTNETFTNVTLDDFTQEGTENYVVTITGVSDDNDYFENIEIHTDKTATGEILDGVYLGTPEDAFVDEDDFLDLNNNSANLSSVERSEDMATDGNTQTNLGVVASNAENTYTLAFDGAPTFTSDDGSFNSADGDSLTSDGNTLVYKVDGNTITAYDVAVDGSETNADRVFVITLDKNAAGGADDDYSYTQYKNIDHPVVDNDDNVVLTFGFKVNDGAVSSNTVNFEVTVNDSLPTAGSTTVTLNEDHNSGNGKTFSLSEEGFNYNTTEGSIGIDVDNNGTYVEVAENASVDILDSANDTDVIGSLTNHGNGTLTFTPSPNYSNYSNDLADLPSFGYRVSDSDGDSADGVVTLEVNPVADAPTDQANFTVNTYEDANTTDAAISDGNQREGLNLKVLGLELPTKNDQDDQNDSDVVDSSGTTIGDSSERLGTINFSFNSSGNFGTAIIGYDSNGDGTLDATLGATGEITKNSTFSVDITDVPNYHVTGTSGTYHLTEAQYQSIAIIHEEDNARNIKIKIQTQSHEVKEDGSLLDVDVASSVVTQNITLDVHAVTEDIELQWDQEPAGYTISSGANTNDTMLFADINEGEGAIDLQNLISKMSGYIGNTSNDESTWTGDLDGSEKRTYTIEGIPEGTIISIGGDNLTGAGGTTAVAGSNGIATVTYTYEFIDDNTNENIDNNPEFLMTFPTDYSGTIENAKITLSVQDIDPDGTNGEVKTADLFFKITVDAVAGEATLSINQPKGFEDAGRTGSNDGDATTDAPDIDAPDNGIVMELGVESSDSSETFTVHIDEIPDGGHIYYNGRLYNENGLVTTNANSDANVDTNVSVDNSGTGWKLEIAEYDETTPPKYIPVHNSNDDVMVQIYAQTVDTYIDGAGITQTDTNTVVDGMGNPVTVPVTIQVKGVADIPVNTELNSIDRNSSAIDDADAIYALVLDENNTGTIINFEEIYSGTGLDSYDNSGTEGSEVLTVVLTGLSADFSVSGSGAAFMGGTGENRKWVIAKDELDQVDITTPSSYSGEVDFQVRYITTEDDGNSKTSDPQDVKVLVKPVDEATLSSSTLEVQEDVSAQINTSLLVDDTNEELVTFKVLKSDVDSKEFTLSIGEGVGSVNINTMPDDGTYYVLTPTQANDLHVLYNSDLGSSADNSFTVKYTTSDTVTGLSDGVNGGELVDLSAEKTVTINLNLNAVTDDISIEATNIIPTVVDGANITVDETNATEKVTINSTGEFTVDLNLNSLASDGNGDTHNESTQTGDGSETVTRLLVEGVPLGISVDGGTFAQTGGGTSLWFIDIPDTQLDGSNTLTFRVNDDLAAGTGTLNIVTITAYNEDGAGSTETTATTQIILEDNISSSGGPGGTVTAELDLKPYEVVEDVRFTLDDIVTVTPDASRNDEAYSISFTGLENVSVSDASLANLSTYEENGETVYVLSIGMGDISTALQSIELVPEANFNENNGVGEQVKIEATLSAYVPNTSVASVDSETFIDTAVTPVTDAISATNTPVTIDEDATHTFDIALDTVDDLDASGNFASDGPNTDGSDYTLIGDVTIHRSGVDGVLKLSNGTTVVFDGSDNATISTADLTGLVFTPTEHIAGQAVFTYSATTQENGAANQASGGGNITINVTPVVDGLDLSGLSATGRESTDGNAFKFTEVTIGSTMLDTDGSETLQTLILDGVPDGFLVYIGNTGSETLAQNAGENTDGDNTWNIDISSGIPKVWIVAPEYWSGTVADMKVISYVDDSGSLQRTETVFSMTVSAVASSIAIAPTKTFADNYDWTDININASMTDLDGSETMTLTLEGANIALDASAEFRLADGSSVDSVFNAGVWTLSNIATDQINNLEIRYHEYSDTVNVSAKTVDGMDVLSPAITDSFNMNIAGTATTGIFANTILTDGNFAINTGTGEDTIVLTEGVNLDTINYDNLDNIEIIDLSVNGDHTLANLKLSDIVSMTDVDNELTILGDSGDTVGINNDLTMGTEAGEWNLDTVDNGSNTTYTYSEHDGAGGFSDSITLTVDDQINSSGM